MEKKVFFKNLENIICSYDNILFLLCDKPEIVSGFNNVKEWQKNKSIVLLKEKQKTYIRSMEWAVLDEESENILQKLYFTYEFSNKFRLISAGRNYGTIFNYVKTGLLSPEEAASALLD